MISSELSSMYFSFECVKVNLMKTILGENEDNFFFQILNMLWNQNFD